jgi:hypothetical protein
MSGQAETNVNIDGKPPVVVEETNNQSVKKDQVQRRFLNGWSKEQENLMANWGDLSVCYRFLHDKSHKIYRKKALLISSSVIVLSSVGGFANIGVQSLFKDDEKAKELASFAIGGLSLLAGMLTTLNNLLKYSQLEESHRVSAIAWSKFGRLIMVELALHPNDRMDSLDFLKICRAELDRLIEQSPTIPQNVINEFEKKFGSIKDLKKPEVCGNLEHTSVFQSSEERLKKLATEAALMLRRKKDTLKELVTPDMESKIAIQVNERIDNAITERRKRLEEEIELKRKEDEDKRRLDDELIQKRKEELEEEINLAKKKLEEQLESERKIREEKEKIMNELSNERKKLIKEEIELEKKKAELAATGIDIEVNNSATAPLLDKFMSSSFENRLSMNRAGSRSGSRSRSHSIRRRSIIGDGIYTLETTNLSNKGIIKVNDLCINTGIVNNKSNNDNTPKNEIIIVDKE